MRLLVSLVLLLLAGNAMAQEPLPTLEIGVGAIALNIPDYRGSADSSSYLLPIPYIKYRGDRLRVDDGAKGVIFESEGLLFTLSANFSFPADDDTREREGMDELDAILEIGPAINYRFYRMQHSALWIDLPLRYGYTLDSEFDNIGYILEPRLSWRKPATRLGEWKLFFSIGPLFANNDYHDYFYSVDPADATSSRPAYQADGGYSGFRSTFSYSKRIGQYWLGGFIRYDNLDGAVIDDSPLVSENESWMGGIALAWVFHQR